MLQIYPIGTSAALEYAVLFLKKAGYTIIDHPTPEVTHLLLDVPSFGSDGLLRNRSQIEKVLETLPQYITVVGGNLDHPALEGYKVLDLLQDEGYLAKNAAITADCALQVAAPLLTTTFSQTKTLIIGLGRIGKCLAQMLRQLGCDVTVAARKIRDRAMLETMGYAVVHPEEVKGKEQYRLILNTAPDIVIPGDILKEYANCVKIDLASRKGLIGEDVVWARGLPGIYAPESSGRLIADALIHYIKEEG